MGHEFANAICGATINAPETNTVQALLCSARMLYKSRSDKINQNCNVFRFIDYILRLDLPCQCGHLWMPNTGEIIDFRLAQNTMKIQQINLNARSFTAPTAVQYCVIKFLPENRNQKRLVKKKMVFFIMALFCRD